MTRSIPERRGASGVASRRVPDDPAAAGAAWSLWLAACVLAAARAALAFVPTMHLWSLNLQRFLAPPAAWLPWALAALALIPPVARRATAGLAAAGERLARVPALLTLACMGAAAALTWMLPDRVRFVGDFLLRQGTVEEAEKPSVVFPQALPLDVFLHYRLPLLAGTWGLADANGAARLLGALEAALLAWGALAFARVLGRRGASAVATATIVFFGGYLGMLTGYSKAFSELMLLNVAVAVAGLAALRSAGRPASGQGLLPLGLAVAAGAVLHRSALGLVPVMAVVWVAYLRADARRGAWRRPAVILAFAIPVLAIAAMAPRIVADVLRWDVVHFNPAEVRAAGGPLRGTLAGHRPLDLLNLILLLSPLAIAAPVAAWRLRGTPGPEGAGPRRELLVLGVLALPMLLAGPFIHPAQGLFRDWDDFAAAGVAFSLVTAWVAGEALRRAPRQAWVAATIAAAVAVPAVQWLALHADTERGRARVSAFVSEPPQRTPAERAKTWDYVGIVSYRAEHWSDAAAAFAHAAETGPSYRILLQWAMSATNAGDLSGAADIYRRLLTQHPDATLGWLGLGAVSSRLAEAAPAGPGRAAQVAESRRAAHELLKLQPGNADAAGLLRYLDARYGAEPGGAGR